MREITNRDELEPTTFDAFAPIYGKPSVPEGSKKYILEFKRFVHDPETTKAVAYYLGPQERGSRFDTNYVPPKIIQNSKWYIPSEEKYGRQGKAIYTAPVPFATNGIRVFEMPTRAKEIMAESVVRQRTGIELPEEIKASLRKSMRNNMGGKRRRARKSTRRHHKSSKKTLRRRKSYRK